MKFLFNSVYEWLKTSLTQFNKLFYGSWWLFWAELILAGAYISNCQRVNCWLDNHFSVVFDFFHLICTGTFTNIVLVLLIIRGTAYIISSNWKDQLINRIEAGAIVLTGSFLIWSNGRYYYFTIMTGVSYRSLLLLICVILVFCNVLKLFTKNITSCNQKVKSTNGFISDDDTYSNLDLHREKLAEVVVGRILNTQSNRESFAVGIVGGWGLGKTRFLEEIEKQIGNKAIIIHFAPWNCSSPSQIVEDFITELRQKLSPCLGSLKRPLTEYAEQLSFIDDHKLIKIIRPILHQMNQSISATKSRLSEEIERLHQPIVVFIDDLDRLEAQELFEVLRIIRNTISFQNLYYIVAYDKNYALQTLEQQGIAEAEHYFEKIFQVEIPLPNPSIYTLFDMFRKDIKSMFSEKDLMDKGIPQFRNPTNSLRSLRSKPPRMRFLLFKLAFCHILTDMSA